jgi:hypothetical protein
MTSAAASQNTNTNRSVDREAAELRRRWWDERETTPELVLDAARFETRTGRVVIAPGEGTRPGLLEVVAPLLVRHPEQACLHRLVSEAAQATQDENLTVCWRDEEGQWHVDWPGRKLRLVVEGDRPPWEPGVRTWQVAQRAFFARTPQWRVIRRLRQGIPAIYFREDAYDPGPLKWDEEKRHWRTGMLNFEDTPYATHSYSLSIRFRREDGVVEFFESVDTE